MSYYLLDNRNPNGDHFYTSRRKPLVGIVVHCTAGLEDTDMLGDDHSAEKTAQYAASTSRSVSWHSGSDSDSVVELLPASHTAWHVKGYNSSTYGHEISKKDMTWADEPADWVAATLQQAAGHLAGIARAAGIPLRKVTVAELDGAIRAGRPQDGGFIGHRELDPSRRSDPGADFPWGRFIDLLTNGREDGDMLKRGDSGQRVTALQARLTWWRGEDLEWDGDYGPATEAAVKRFQNHQGVTEDGVWTDTEWALLVVNAIGNGHIGASGSSEHTHDFADKTHSHTGQVEVT